MSESLTKQNDFRTSPMAPLLRSGEMSPKIQVPISIRTLLAAAAFNLTMYNAPPFVSVSVASERAISGAESQGNGQASPAALTRKSVELKLEEFLCAFNEAVELSVTMAWDDERASSNAQTCSYVAQTLCPLVTF